MVEEGSNLAGLLSSACEPWHMPLSVTKQTTQQAQKETFFLRNLVLTGGQILWQITTCPTSLSSSLSQKSLQHPFSASSPNYSDLCRVSVLQGCADICP